MDCPSNPIKINPIKENELELFADILINAFPGRYSPIDKECVTERMAATYRMDGCELIGLYHNGTLAGGMILHDYTMNFHGTLVQVGGLGSLAVDLLYKKEHVGKQLILHFLDHYSKKKSPIALLYPFNVKFYKDFGFGLGTKINRYTIPPKMFPYTSKEYLQFIPVDSIEKVFDAYDTYVKKCHGMIVKSPREKYLAGKNKNLRCVAVIEPEGVKGYCTFEFNRVTEIGFTTNDMVIREFIYHDSKTLLKLLSFFHSQHDQLRYIILNCFEPLEMLLDDVYYHHGMLIPHVYHQSNIQGVGIMYKVLDIEQVLTVAELQNKVDFSIEFTITDMIDWKESQVVLQGKTSEQISISISIGEFSSLIMGAVDFATLIRLGAAYCSDLSKVETITRLFTCTAPQCTTIF
ncbi:MAG: GNAT family N-acetyltransferase [Chitinivibrionales bacterium]|nr:GNAT family N-acetyltransferase [Chitinivibrionales bacterium]